MVVLDEDPKQPTSATPIFLNKEGEVYGASELHGISSQKVLDSVAKISHGIRTSFDSVGMRVQHQGRNSQVSH